MECWSDGVMSETITPTLHYSISASSRRGEKLLADAQLGVLRKENLADEDFVRRQIPSGDGGGIIDVLERIDQDRAGFVVEGVVIGPDGQNGFGGIAEINLETLLARKIEDDPAFRNVLERKVHLELAHFG